MNVSVVCCPRCRSPLPAGQLDRREMSSCRACGTPLRVRTFPALVADYAPGRTGQVLLDEAEASCFYHRDKRATVPCDACGRFLCSLCDIQVGARHICPSCIQSAQGHAGASELDAHRVRYDSLALALAIVPTIVTPAVSVYLAVRYWSAPMSLVHSSRIRWVLALLASAGQTGFWAWLFLS